MIDSLKKIVIPQLKVINFKGTFPHFRKTIDDKTNLITFQFDRNRGGFIIEIANFKGSTFMTHWSELIPLNKLTAHHLNERKRIYPNSLSEESGTDSWFRYDKNKLFSFGNKYDNLSKKVIDRFQTMEDYWNEI